MDRKPDAREASICVVCAWRETCVKKFSFTGQHCLEYTRDMTIKARPEGEGPKRRGKRVKGEKAKRVGRGRALGDQ